MTLVETGMMFSPNLLFGKLCPLSQILEFGANHGCIGYTSYLVIVSPMFLTDEQLSGATTALIASTWSKEQLYFLDVREEC